MQKVFFYNFFLVKNTATIDFASTERHNKSSTNEFIKLTVL